MIDDERERVSGMRTGRRNQSTRRKPAPVPLLPPQIPHDWNLARTRVDEVGRTGGTLCLLAGAVICLIVLHKKLTTIFFENNLLA
jgi:hypothetical protein